MNWAYLYGTNQTPPLENGTQQLLLMLNVTSQDENSRVGMAAYPNWWRERVQVTPDWTHLWSRFGWTWLLHTYGLACLFLVLSCATFFTILGLRAQLSSRPHLSTLNVFLCLMATSRALTLFIDPYGSKELMPQVMIAILRDLTFPCLLSAFTLLQLAFLQMTQVKVGPPRLSSETCTTLVVTSHFCLVMASDILWTLQNSMRILWLVTQITYATWGLFLCITFLCGCVRLIRSIAKVPLVFLMPCETTSYENKGVLHMGALHGDQQSLSKGSYAPKIKITDENDQTFSYASEASQPNVIEIAVGDPSSPVQQPAGIFPARPSTVHSEKEWRRNNATEVGKKQQLIDDANQRKPLIENFSNSLVGHCAIVAEDSGEYGPMLIHNATNHLTKKEQANNIMTQSISSSKTSPGDFKFDAHKLKPSRRTHVEKLLRKIMFTAVLAALICTLQLYGVFGPHGLSAGQGSPGVVPWFCYQTFYRVTEFIMGCTMTAITRQSLQNTYHNPYGSGGKHRTSLFT